MKTKIEKYNPCENGLEYYNSFDTVIDAWNNCPRGDWMLWFAAKLKLDRRKIALASGLCANTVIHLMHHEESKIAVSTTIRYGNGEASEKELKDASADAYAASASVDADSAACAAAYAAYAANAAAVYANAAAVYANSASDDADDADYADYAAAASAVYAADASAVYADYADAASAADDAASAGRLLIYVGRY